jgi:L-rhamnonate dehydratase
VKITEIRINRLNAPRRELKTEPRRQPWAADAEVANPMSRYPKVKRHRGLWLPRWGSAWVQVVAEDGTWGLGVLNHAQPCIPVVEHLASQLVGEDCMAIDKLADMMFRMTKAYGSTGLASYAISAIDLALWDLKGKLLDRPVYSLLGGAQKDRIFCYATGNEEFVAQARELIGDECELMLDCWMAFDVEYTVRLAEVLRPYRLKWMEECLLSEDYDAHVALRQRLPWQTLSTGEHWYTHVPFQWAVRHQAVDILQPDINWVGGVSTCQKIAAMADGGGLSVILHGGGNTPYGQHFSYATPSVPWCECFVATPPGVPLEEAWRLPGQAAPVDGWLVPSDGPGFGLDIPEEWLEPYGSA